MKKLISLSYKVKVFRMVNFDLLVEKIKHFVTEVLRMRWFSLHQPSTVTVTDGILGRAQLKSEAVTKIVMSSTYITDAHR